MSANDHTLNVGGFGVLRDGLDAFGQRMAHAFICLWVGHTDGTPSCTQRLTKVITGGEDDKELVAGRGVLRDGAG